MTPKRIPVKATLTCNIHVILLSTNYNIGTQLHLLSKLFRWISSTKDLLKIHKRILSLQQTRQKITYMRISIK